MAQVAHWSADIHPVGSLVNILDPVLLREDIIQFENKASQVIGTDGYMRWIRVTSKYGTTYHVTEHMNMLREHES